jgi:pyridoxine/pyridoxamine 5'-phosphate oxidase
VVFVFERLIEEVGAWPKTPMTIVSTRRSSSWPAGKTSQRSLRFDDDHLLINTEVHRQKFKNVERDPRVTLTIWDREDPYRFVEVRGEVVEKVKGPEARKHIDELSQKYHGRPYQTRIRSERVVLRIAPLRQVIRIPS